MSDLRPPRVPCLDHSCACCDEWITSHRQMIASYTTDLDGARRLSDTLWQQMRRLVSDLSRSEARVRSLQRQLLDSETHRG